MRACNDGWSEQLSALVDGEATELERARVEAHLRECGACASAAEAYGALGDWMRREAVVEVPERVRRRALTLARPKRSLRRRALTAVAVATAVLGLSLAPALVPGGPDEGLAHEMSQHHFRAFARSQPCDFESSDAAEVEAWLQEVLGYAVAVPEVPGAILLGARRCRIGGVLTAAILYRVEDEALTLFVPQPDAPAGKVALALAEGGTPCIEGALGEAICVIPGDLAPILAVGGSAGALASL